MVTAHATYQHRGYCSKAGYAKLKDLLGELKNLYNAALQERKDAYRYHGKTVSWVDQNRSLTAIRADWPEFEGAVDRRVQRGVLRRLDRAYQAFFRRVKAGETPGFPRFKGWRYYRTIDVEAPTPAMVKVRPDGRKAWVRIKGLPAVEVRLKRPLPALSGLETLRLVVRPTGLWVDLGFAVERETLPPVKQAVGIDMGISDRLALSDGQVIERRKIDRARQARLQQELERSTKRDSVGRMLPHKLQSNRREKRRGALARESFRNQLRNRNAMHRMTTDIVRRYGRIAVEKLNIRNMTRSAAGTVEEPGVNVAQKRGLDREIMTQTWGLIREQLRYKAEWAGREFVEVDPKFTSQLCSRCGLQGKRDGKDFSCGNCGLKYDADQNAAVNVLRRAFGPTGGYVRRQQAGDLPVQAVLLPAEIQLAST